MNDFTITITETEAGLSVKTYDPVLRETFNFTEDEMLSAGCFNSVADIWRLVSSMKKGFRNKYLFQKQKT